MSRRPTQQLNIHCSNCRAVTVRFESFAADGVVFEMLGQKLSEMMSFISASPEVVLCSTCAAQAAAEAENRRLQHRDRLIQQLEIRPTASTPTSTSEQPATYATANTRSKASKLQHKSQREGEAIRPLPRRAVSNREQISSVR